MPAHAEALPSAGMERPLPAAIAPAKRRDWTDLPEAAAILADCAANPPATHMAEITDLTTYHTPLYVGARVRRLRAIHRAEADRLFGMCEAAREYEAFEAHCRLGVQQAIADALFHAALARSAACDRRALATAEAFGRGEEGKCARFPTRVSWPVAARCEGPTPVAGPPANRSD